MEIDVKKIAKLAKLKITEKEEITLKKNFQDIIKMIDRLDKDGLDSDNDKLEDILLNDLPEMKYRDDIETLSMTNKELIDNAPKSLAGCIIVPKIVE